MKRLEIVKEMRIIHLIMSFLMILAGIFLLAWPEVATQISRYLLGGTFLLLGAARVLGYFANDLYRLAFQYDLALGSLAFILGVLFIVSRDKVQAAFPYIIGVYVLIDALFKLQTAMDAREFGMRSWVPLMITAVAITGAAIAILIMQTTLEQTFVLIPIALILDGAESFWNTLGTVRIRTKKEGRYEELVKDKEFEFIWKK